MALHTVIPAVRRVPQQPNRLLCSVLLLLLSVSFSGCASIRESVRSSWKPKSSDQFANRPHEANERTTKKLPPTEPAVAANVALGSDSVQELAASPNGKSDSRVKSADGRNDAPQGPSESRTSDIAARSDSKNAVGANFRPFGTANDDDVSMERLTAALSDDGLPAELLPQRSLTALDDQVRIEALMAQANRLLANGQLENARQKAQRAQDLSEKAQIDYAPDEERPIDLVRRIQGQLQATRLQDESQLDRNISESLSSPSEQNNPDVAIQPSKPASTASKDASNLSRLRRDWSTLFRREKKSSPHESAPANQNVDPAPLPPTTAPPLPDQQANRTSESEERNAIVMANRSVSLGATEISTASSAVLEADVDDSDAMSTEPILSESRSHVESEIPGLQDLRENSLRDLFETSKANLRSDEGAEVPTDIDDADVVISFSEAESFTNERPRSEATEPTNVPRQSDWTGLYVGFGLCFLLAIACYRRGAV